MTTTTATTTAAYERHDTFATPLAERGHQARAAVDHSDGATS